MAGRARTRGGRRKRTSRSAAPLPRRKSGAKRKRGSAVNLRRTRRGTAAKRARPRGQKRSPSKSVRARAAGQPRRRAGSQAARPRARVTSKRKGKTAAQRGRIYVRRRKKGQRPSRAWEIKTALDVLGWESVKRGTTVEIGKTRWLTPTSRGGKKGQGGMGAVERELQGAAALQRAALADAERAKQSPLLTFNLEAQMRGRDGKTYELDPQAYSGFVLPRPQDVQRRKGESLARAYRREVRRVVADAVFSMVRAEWGNRYGHGATSFPELAEKVGYEKARKRLKYMKRQAKVRFRVSFSEVVKP